MSDLFIYMDYVLLRNALWIQAYFAKFNDILIVITVLEAYE